MILETLLSGGLMGAIGSLVTNITEIFKQKQMDKHEMEMRRLDLEAMDKEYEMMRENSADELMESSYEHDSSVLQSIVKKVKPNPIASLLIIIIEAIRALVRPVLTIYLIYEVHVVRSDVDAVLQRAGVDGLDVTQALALYGEVSQMVLFLASMAVAWWFGTRKKLEKSGNTVNG